MISALLGGIGLFLLGMVLMTEGLKAAAGGTLRDVLGRFTGGPLSAFLSGAGLTALIQSSSATLLTTLGFVSAGLLTFTQSVGVIFGATVGTTSTGWLVAFLGLRYSVSALALPLVGVGAFLRLLGRDRLASLGLVLAGFGLIFVGIDTLQLGMQHLSERIDLRPIAAEGWGGRVLLVLIGAAMTVVMQSSSAAVATTLAALHADTIGLGQAAALVIGQNVGTTVTAGLASIGAAIPARRTALAHILLNGFTGLLALAMLPLYLAALVPLAQSGAVGPAGSIAAFHTAFTLAGVLILLPLTSRYAALVARLVPERGPPLTRFLDASVRSVPTVAVEAARRTMNEVAGLVLATVRAVLLRGRLTGHRRQAIEAAHRALEETRRFLSGVRSSPEARRDYGRHLAVLHAADHLERLIDGLRDPPPPGWLHEDPTLGGVAAQLAEGLREPIGWLAEAAAPAPVSALERLSRQTAESRRAHRPAVMARTASGEVAPEAGLRTLDAMRWVDRLAYHVWRAVHHLAAGGGEVVSPEATGAQGATGRWPPRSWAGPNEDS